MLTPTPFDLSYQNNIMQNVYISLHCPQPHTGSLVFFQVCFFRQFVRSVPKVDYLTLRHGFIMVFSDFLVIFSSMQFPISLLEATCSNYSICQINLFGQAHLAPQSQTQFDFQKYINRSLEEDFKVVVGIR